MAPTQDPAPGTDLDALLNALDTIHPDAFHGIARDEWVSRLETLKQDLDELTPFEAEVELMRLVALLSREGRDGHQFAIPVSEAPVLPIRLYEFDDGVFVTDALEPNVAIVGREITALNGHPIEGVLAALEPLVPRDGPATVRGFRPVFMTRTSVLQGLGLIDDGPVPVSLRDESGTIDDVMLEPVPFRTWSTWTESTGPALPHREDTLYLSRSEPKLWWEMLDDGSTLYVRYQLVATIGTADAAAIREAATAPRTTKVILDLRQNPGGDNHYFPILLDVLRAPEVDVDGRLFVLTDRLTFSAAANFATSIEQSTQARFAGEPMGGGLNFWDDVTWIQLGNYPVPMEVGVSTRYWQFADADDPRLTIEPQIAVPVLSADFFGGSDPVLEAVLAE